MTAVADFEAVRAAVPLARWQPTEAYAIDGVLPVLAVRPADRHELAAVLAAAARSGLAVVPQGARTALRLGRPLERYDLALDTRGLDRVVAYEPDDMTATVEAGVTLEALRARLAEHGQELTVDAPPDDGVTIGGLLATARPGAWRGHLPGQRDLVLGITVALPDGALTTSGGRVVKNVSGYDLHRMHTGALGALGVIVEASFKLAPRPASMRSVAIRCTQGGHAEAIAFDLWDRSLATRAISVLGPAAAEAAGLPAALTVLVQFGGSEAAVSRSLRDVHDVAALGHALAADEVGDEAWARLRRLAAGDDARDDVALRLGVAPSSVVAALEAVSATDVVAWAHLAAGSVLLRAPTMDAARVLALREEAVEAGGFLQIEAAPASLRAEVDPFASVETDLVRSLKAQFDAAGTLNPGRWLDGV